MAGDTEPRGPHTSALCTLLTRLCGEGWRTQHSSVSAKCQAALMDRIIGNQQPEFKLGKRKGNLKKEPSPHLTPVSKLGKSHKVWICLRKAKVGE